MEYSVNETAFPMLDDNQLKAWQTSVHRQKATNAVKVSAKVVATVAVMSVLANPAFADLQGGMTKAQNEVTQFRDSLMLILGVVATVYLLWKALDAWQGRADWKEFGLSVLYVAVAGGAVKLAEYAWTYFTT